LRPRARRGLNGGGRRYIRFLRAVAFFRVAFFAALVRRAGLRAAVVFFAALVRRAGLRAAVFRAVRLFLAGIAGIDSPPLPVRDGEGLLTTRAA
jgi:hypothetical protein